MRVRRRLARPSSRDVRRSAQALALCLCAGASWGCAVPQPQSEGQQFFASFSAVASGRWSVEPADGPATESVTGSAAQPTRRLTLTFDDGAVDPVLGRVEISGGGAVHEYIAVVASSAGTGEPSGSLILGCMAVDAEGRPQPELVHLLWSPFNFSERLRVSGLAWFCDEPVICWREPPPATLRDALSVVRHADAFSMADVGEGKVCSPEVRAFSVLLDQPDAPQFFQSLLSDATPAGQLYALCGLWLTDLPAYEAAEPRFAQSLMPVSVQAGCEIFPVKMSMLVRPPESVPRASVSNGKLPMELLAYVESQS